MNPIDIQYQLKKRGLTQKSIAAELNVHPMTVSLVINKKTVSDRVMRAIALKIGKNHNEVFPEYYFKLHKRSTSATAKN